MQKVSIILFLLLCVVSGEAIPNENENDHDLLEKTMAFISKQGFKILVSPAFLKAEIKVILGKEVPKALAKAAAKDLPLLGAFSGLGFGLWRFASGQYKSGVAEIVSGFAGATGVGIGASLAIDIGLILSDIVSELEDKKIIST